MKKRTVLFGNYNTAKHGWTLTGFHLTDPEQKTNYVEKQGGDGSWDLSTVMTNGVPRYKDRTLTVTLECSEGTHDDREDLINEMVNTLDGLVWQVVPPDRPGHYLVSRLAVKVGFNNLAYAQVTVTGICEPWLYSRRETVLSVYATDQLETLHLSNKGRRVVTPKLTAGGAVNLVYNGMTTSLRLGTYEWQQLMLTPGRHELQYSGYGELEVRYREAVLR